MLFRSCTHCKTPCFHPRQAAPPPRTLTHTSCARPPLLTLTPPSPQGTVEDWVIENQSGENHVFHIHQIHFLLLEVNGAPVAPEDQQFLDVVQVPYWSGSGPYPSVKIRLCFCGPDLGVFVYHCHLLGHEDQGMMANIEIVPGVIPVTSAAAGSSGLRAQQAAAPSGGAAPWMVATAVAAAGCVALAAAVVYMLVVQRWGPPPPLGGDHEHNHPASVWGPHWFGYRQLPHKNQEPLHTV